MQWEQWPGFDPRTEPFADSDPDRHRNADPNAHSHADTDIGSGAARRDYKHDIQGGDQFVHPDGTCPANARTHADPYEHSDAHADPDTDGNADAHPHADSDAHPVARANADRYAASIWQPGQRGLQRRDHDRV